MGQALIVGSAGQVGQQLVHELGADNCIATVRRDVGSGQIVVDLEKLADDTESARTAITPEVNAVYCVGGATDVERCESSPKWAMNTNCYGPVALAAAAPHLPFVCFSTDYVFDGESGPYRETDATHALSMYGKSKLQGEQMLLERHPCVLIVRTNVVYGPDPAGKNFLYSLQRNLQAGTPMRVMDDQISTPTFNQDLAVATTKLVAAGETGIFHISGPDWISRYDFALSAAEILGLDTGLISPVSTAELNQQARRPMKGGLLNERLAKVLPFQVMHGVVEGIRAWKAGDVAADITQNW